MTANREHILLCNLQCVNEFRMATNCLASLLISNFANFPICIDHVDDQLCVENESRRDWHCQFDSVDSWMPSVISPAWQRATTATLSEVQIRNFAPDCFRSTPSKIRFEIHFLDSLETHLRDSLCCFPVCLVFWLNKPRLIAYSWLQSTVLLRTLLIYYRTFNAGKSTSQVDCSPSIESWSHLTLLESLS